MAYPPWMPKRRNPAASAAIQRQYQRNMVEEGYTCFIESDFEDTAGGFSYYTGGGVVIFTKDAQNTSQGDIYWAALNWYGEVLDVGWNRNPLDAARFTLLMQGFLPPKYCSDEVLQLQALLTRQPDGRSRSAPDGNRRYPAAVQRPAGAGGRS